MDQDSMIDLRSDILSRPTEPMIEAMAAAARRPAAFDLREDPDQQLLESRTAELLGQEDALLFPTCTMANQVALALLTRPGSAIVTQSNAHILTSEAGAPAVLSGLLVQTLDGEAMPPLSAWEQAAAQKSDALKPPVAAFALENTHNRSGGVALDAAYTDKVIAIARNGGLKAHLDGARLLNAAVATGEQPARLARGFDTVSLSLNKSLGAPLSAVLAGSKARIAESQRWRQRLGGGIRPTAIVAAAALVALEDWRASIAEDHRRARRLSRSLGSLRHGRVESDPQTNIVILQLDPLSNDADKFCGALAEAGVLALPFGSGRIRLITYRGITDVDIDRAAAIIIEVVSRTAEAGQNLQRRSTL